MKFKSLCNIVLEGKKEDKYARLVIGNTTPTFSLEDVLRDVNDPSKGLKTYLTHRDSKNIGDDYERLARRAVRRLNWIARAAIKKLGSREISLHKLNDFIVGLLEKYQTKVLGYSKPDKLRTAQEARIVGNLLLPPTGWNPNAKSVFVPATETAPGKPKEKVDIDQLAKDFNEFADDSISLYDPDLISTIKAIVRGDGVDADITEESTEASGVSVSTILKDPRIKGIYDPKIVRKVIKGMLEIGSLTQDEAGNFSLPAGGSPAWNSFKKIAAQGKSIDEIPEDEDIDELADTVGSGELMPPTVKTEIEDEETAHEMDAERDQEGARSRLGYSKSDEEDKWY